jgi:surface antigen
MLILPAKAAEAPDIPPAWDTGFLKRPIIMETSKYVTRPVVTVRNYGIGNGFCTDLVKKYRPDLSYISGNANTYLRQGLRTGQIPEVNAVVQTSESWAGHVAIIISMTENTITIKEQNYRCRWCVTTRTLSINDPVIIGYIYK